ncbi:hypothetical protein ACF0H5_016422 [Mactra antiquata]
MLGDEQLTDGEMRHNLCSLFHGKILNMIGTNSSKRKLVLHFDVNKTIVPVDSATGETVEASLNVYLSGMAWGKDSEGEWLSSKGQLSRSPSSVDDVSFYKFEEKRLLPHLTQDRSTLRYHLTSFTDQPQGSNFKPYLNSLLQKLRWTLPYDESLHEKMTVPGTKSCRFHFILPAFYKLLNYLIQNDKNFAVIFRTFGSDARSVLSSIKDAILKKMPFSDQLHVLGNDISEHIYSLKRDKEVGKFRLTQECSTLPEWSKTDTEMYTVFSNMTGINAIQDNVADWSQHNFHPKRGKPVWIDQSDPNIQHIFFDDNIRPGSSDSIVNIRVREPSGNFRDIDSAEEYQFVNNNIVPVTFSEAIQDEDYFVQKLMMCEANHDKHFGLS